MIMNDRTYQHIKHKVSNEVWRMMRSEETDHYRVMLLVKRKLGPMPNDIAQVIIQEQLEESAFAEMK